MPEICSFSIFEILFLRPPRCRVRHYFSGVVEDLNKYYSKRVHKWKAALKQKYFRNPWTIISVVAAAVIVILTIIQTVCSIIQVV
jgi:hypothetical protein